ncbi:hypothetical protein C8F04DRAFT_1258009 [Mycena alexandri]|uniref:Uncharacterized protein n=1 Tax=Mycena alexandri TaxID=1745969 RepID=A0AAD6X2F2_9AGAR|nr:hypothetical protein C8F04DRAFT_1258009 [Mycena alexandri]
MPRSTRARKTHSAPYNFTLAQQVQAAPLTPDWCVALTVAFGVTEADVVYAAWLHSGTWSLSDLGWGAGWGPTPAPSTTAGDTWGTGDGWVVEAPPPPNTALTSRWGVWGTDGEGTGAPRPTSSGWGDTAWSDAAWTAHEAAPKTAAAPSTTGETSAASS